MLVRRLALEEERVVRAHARDQQQGDEVEERELRPRGEEDRGRDRHRRGDRSKDLDDAQGAAQVEREERHDDRQPDAPQHERALAVASEEPRRLGPDVEERRARRPVRGDARRERAGVRDAAQRNERVPAVVAADEERVRPQPERGPGERGRARAGAPPARRRRRARTARRDRA